MLTIKTILQYPLLSLVYLYVTKSKNNLIHTIKFLQKFHKTQARFFQAPLRRATEKQENMG